MSWVERRPEPAGLWIRWYPRRWFGPDRPWCDLARGTLGDPGLESKNGPRRVSAQTPPSKVEDTLYLPPGQGLLRRTVEKWSIERGVPLLVQRQLTGEASGAPEARFAGIAVWDPLSAVLQEEEDDVWLDRLPDGSHLVWPLITGVTDDIEDFSRLCHRFVAKGLQTVQPVPLDLGPREKRWLWENRVSERISYEALFHPEPTTSEAPFVDAAIARGLSVVVPRSIPERLSARQKRCFEAAEHLALAAEELARCDGSPTRVQALYHAAARVEATHLDLDGLARDGNLTFLDVPPAVVARLEEWLLT